MIRKPTFQLRFVPLVVYYLALGHNVLWKMRLKLTWLRSREPSAGSNTVDGHSGQDGVHKSHFGFR